MTAPTRRGEVQQPQPQSHAPLPGIGLTGVPRPAAPNGLKLKPPGTSPATEGAPAAARVPASTTGGARHPALSTVRASHRGLAVVGGVAIAFTLLAVQLVRLAMSGQGELSIAVSEPMSQTHARPDVVDRSGRLIATDLVVHSLYADPAMVLDADIVSEKLAQVLPELDQREVRLSLADKSRRFVWLRRGLPPSVAQRVHDLGLPGLAFRRELRRAYPQGRLAGHVVGSVNIDNRGLSGIERHIDETIGIEALPAAMTTSKPAVALTLDIGAQAAVEDELASAVTRFRAKGAAAIVLDVANGDVLAAASLPRIDPARPVEAQDIARLDKIAGGTFELGSVFKALTVAMALERGQARLDTLFDVRQPLSTGRFTVRDLHASNRPLSLAEIFIHSSNVGAGMIAREAGSGVQRAFLGRFGLLEALTTELGTLPAPQVPTRWEDAETITISYGHGIAVTPLQFAAAAATLVNGGRAVTPRFVRVPETATARTAQVISPATSQRMRELMRLNVTSTTGTGRRADVPGYEVGGKTGTAEMPARGGYREDAVIASFIAAFPMSAPRYVAFVLLFEPQGTGETNGRITAGYNAAATAGRTIARVAPLLGLVPNSRS